MERERAIGRSLKSEVASLQDAFRRLVETTQSSINHLGDERSVLQQREVAHVAELDKLQRDLVRAQAETQQLDAHCKRKEEEWRVTSSLTEQKLRNEILHLSGQIEKCRVETSTQEAEARAELERQRTKVRELEALLVTERVSWSAAERQCVSERDELKQQLLAASEKANAEREAAKQLMDQLRTIQQELSRVVQTADSDRAACAHLQREINGLKEQIQSFGKKEISWQTERAKLDEDEERSQNLICSLRQQVATLEKRLEENVTGTERHKHDYARELERLRLEHSNIVSRLQRDHQKTLDELRENHKKYVEFLEKQTADLKGGASASENALLEMARKLDDAERQLAYSKVQVQELTGELQVRHMTYSFLVNFYLKRFL
ncbi:hypothetical protein PINS_up001245 [Pythium insidiosum]|nr:hypothetical protein PINS_up001245 [Pythium insidiosum]